MVMRVRAEITSAQQQHMGVLRRVEARLTLHCSPSFIGRLHDGARQHVNAMLLKPSEALGGVPIACPALRICSSVATANTDFPLLHFEVDATLVVFAPAVGARLVGRINQISPDHVGLLVLGTFNASIPRTALKSSHYYDTNDAIWCDEASGKQVLQAGSSVAFDVTGFDYADDVLCIQGSIAADSAGFVGCARRCVPTSFLQGRG